MNTWVLVANRAGARLFHQRGRELALLQTIDHDLRGPVGSDRALERETEDAHAAGRVAGDRARTPEQKDAERFARRLAHIVGDARTSHSVRRVVLVAEPGFLGSLRHEVNRVSPGILTATFPKDLHRVPDGELAGRLDRVLLPS